MENKKKPPIVLLAFANDVISEDKKYLINIRKEWKGIKKVLTAAQKNELCKPVFLHDATLEDIVRAFQNPDYKDRIAIFHFAGHAEDYILLLEGPLRERDIVYADGFSTFLADQKSLKLVFLNACTTIKQAKLINEQGIPVVIATNAYIDDQIAKDISINFYSSLASGTNISASFDQAISLIKSKTGPVNNRALYKSGHESDIIPWEISTNKQSRVQNTLKWNFLDAVDKPLINLPTPNNDFPIIPFPGLIPYQREQMNVFWGRDAEIKELYDLLVKDNNARINLIYGGSGVGKTSLINAGVLPRLEKDYQIRSYTQEHWRQEFPKYKNDLQSEELEPLVKPTLIIIDDFGVSNQDYYDKYIFPLLAIPDLNLKFVLVLRTIYIQKWSGIFDRLEIKTNKYFLKPFSLKGLQKIILGFVNSTTAKEHYNVTIQTKLCDRIIQVLNYELNYPVIPYLQYILSSLWKHAISQSLSSIHITTELLDDLQGQNLWKGFINQRLEKIDNLLFKEGLLYNILELFIQSREAIHFDEMIQKFPEGKFSMTNLLDGLISERLISYSAFENQEEIKKLYFPQTLLAVPLLELINNSDKPGQKIKRYLSIYSDNKGILSKSELALFDQFKHTLPELDQEKYNLIQRSRIANRKIYINKISKRAILIITSIIVFALGMFFDDPFLLLWIILLIAFFQK